MLSGAGTCTLIKSKSFDTLFQVMQPSIKQIYSVHQGLCPLAMHSMKHYLRPAIESFRLPHHTNHPVHVFYSNFKSIGNEKET